MALSGQLNKLAYEIKDALEDGVETTGLVCTDGTPAYGGIDTGEDFAGFTIYSINLDDDIDDDWIFHLPLIRFDIRTTVVEYYLDASAVYKADIIFNIFMDEEHEKTIDSTLHTRKTLMNWYLERLEYLLYLLDVTVVQETASRNLNSQNHGRMTENDEFFYVGETYLTIEYLREVS